LMIVHSKSLEEVKSHGNDIIDDPWLSSFVKEQKEKEDWGHKKEVELFQLYQHQIFILGAN